MKNLYQRISTRIDSSATELATKMMDAPETFLDRWFARFMETAHR